MIKYDIIRQHSSINILLDVMAFVGKCYIEISVQSAGRVSCAAICIVLVLRMADKSGYGCVYGRSKILFLAL